MNISKHITYSEATHTDTGLKNVPGLAELRAMQLIANEVFEPLRLHLGRPVRISSFYRSPAVNKKVGGVKTSQHVKGEAMDIKEGREVFEWIRDNLVFDQCIMEPNWVHVSYRDGNNRGEVLDLR